MKKLSLLCFALMIATLAFSQHTVTGTVVDKDNNDPLMGTTVRVKGTTIGIATDLDGKFSLSVPDGKQTLVISFVGYIDQEISKVFTDKNSKLGTIQLENNAIGLNEVQITSTVAIARKTPVAVSTISAATIQNTLGTKEFPELFNSTPSVYATKQGGGYGDSRINIRGFESPNIATMVNGVPVNDMEWGGVYWSNWAGLADVTRSTQIQRGLGAAKISVPSVGGSMNVITKTTDMDKGGSVYYGVGNDGYNKMTFSVSTGLMKNGWAVTMLGSKNWGNGYIQGTDFNAYSWFLNVSKRISKKQEISFTAFGAPQTHGKRDNGDQLTIAEWQKQKLLYKYNAAYGYGVNGQAINPGTNVYNKPQFSINHFLTIDDKSSLATVAYLSLGMGGGYGFQGEKRSELYGASAGVPNSSYRNLDGTRDFATLQQENAANLNGSGTVMNFSKNEHVWTGLLSTYTRQLTDEINFYGGIDLRYYEGLHQNVITDLMGGSFYMDNASRATAAKARGLGDDYIYEKLKVGDVVYRDYTGYVAQSGVFGQMEYSKDKLSTFVAGTFSNKTYWKVDRFYANNEQTPMKSYLGFNVKGGANYNIDDHNNVFFNTGYISKQPFMSGGYIAGTIATSNVVNNDAKNEKSYSFEGGYGYTAENFTAKVGGYYTIWNDRTMTRAYGQDNNANINLSGVNSRYSGLELELEGKPTSNLTLKGMVSIGNWEWINKASGYVYTIDGEPADISGNAVNTGEFGADHAKITIDMEGVKVGNSAQTTGYLGATYELLDGFSIGLTENFFANNYANFRIAVGSTNDQKYYTPWKIPVAAVTGLNAHYNFKMAGFKATVTGNVDNLFNQEYITDATDLNPNSPTGHTWENATVFYGFGTTWSVGLKVRF